MEEVNDILRHQTAVVLGLLAKKIATMEKQNGPRQHGRVKGCTSGGGSVAADPPVPLVVNDPRQPVLVFVAAVVAVRHVLLVPVVDQDCGVGFLAPVLEDVVRVDLHVLAPRARRILQAHGPRVVPRDQARADLPCIISCAVIWAPAGAVDPAMAGSSTRRRARLAKTAIIRPSKHVDTACGARSPA